MYVYIRNKKKKKAINGIHSFIVLVQRVSFKVIKQKIVQLALNGHAYFIYTLADSKKSE